MFERFTDRARKAVVLAQQEARNLRHPYIDGGHLLIGLASEDCGGVAQLALTALGVTADSARDALLALMPRGDVVPAGHIPFTRMARNACEDALRESLQLGHNYIGTEHLLLGLMRPDDSEARMVIDRLNLTGQDVRESVLELLRGYAATEQARPAALAPGEAVLWSDQSAGDRLALLLADLEGFIERRAADLAAPAIEAAERARASAECRIPDMQREFQRRIEALQRQLARAKAESVSNAGIAARALDRVAELEREATGA